MFVEIYKQSEIQIKAEIFYKGKTFLKHWFRYGNGILIQKYLEVHNETYPLEA